MYKTGDKRLLKEATISILFFIAILFIWERLVLYFNVPEYILPKPTRIAKEIFENFSFLMINAGVTAKEALIGYLIGNTLGFLAAVIFVHFKTIEKGFYPYAIALKTTPLVALVPLLVLWFGPGAASKSIASAIICFFPILVNANKGLKKVDAEMLDLFKSFSASRWQIFLKLRFHNSLPDIFSALKISTGLALVGAIVGEFIGASKGMGYVILTSYYYFEIARMFAAVVIIALLGTLFFGLVSLIEKKVVFWD